MVTVLTGENDVLRIEALQRIVDAFTSSYGDGSDMALERLDGEEVTYERMHEAVQSLPFLSSKKLVVLRRPSANKEFTEKFEDFLGDIAETNDVVLLEPKLDKRLAYYKTLKKMTGFNEYVLLDGNGLARYLVDYATRVGGRLSLSDARLLIERVGLKQLRLQHEVDKLVAYNATISKMTIELLTERTPQSSIFELLEAAFSGETSRAMKLYREQRSLKVEPQQILAMIVWQLHILALVKTAGQRSAAEIATAAKVSPYTVQKTQKLARTMSILQLKKLLFDLRQFDVRLKSEGLIADEVMQYYLLTIK